MAFNDILEAINRVYDEKIALLRDRQTADLARMNDETNAAIADEQQRSAAECAREKKNLERRASSRAHMESRMAILHTKKRALDAAYDAALKRLASLQPAQIATLLQNLIDKCPTDGTLLPATPHVELITKLAANRTVGPSVNSVGGFIFSAPNRELDCTFEALIRDIVRPATELEVSDILFPAGNA